MKQFSSWLDNTKLRVSYGVTGNPNVHWEKVKKVNFGLDYGFWSVIADSVD